MNLTKDNLGKIVVKNIALPQPALFALPEKVLQFGTGVLLRALPDYFIDKANKQGIFNGRVVVVKSTETNSDAFDRQDGLYTICVRGIQDGVQIEENLVNASISRVLSAKTAWHKVLECAANPEMKIIISNTTEVGIRLMEDQVKDNPPISFPGKLLSFLQERYRYWKGDAAAGMVILPTELITDNGNELKAVVLELAKQNNLEAGCIDWINNHNSFCNTLVDRIVPGKPNANDLQDLENKLGYQDELLCMSEVFKLWAIEGDEKVREILSFATADSDVIIQPDITIFKELKLRLLNGTHSFNCGLAYLSGFDITRKSVQDPVFGAFAKKLMFTEIANAIPYPIATDVKAAFAAKVFDRFCNPFIDHQWLSITLHYTAKMKMRNIPLLLHHYKNNDWPPICMATGFAGFLLFMKAVKQEGDIYYGLRDGAYYEINDKKAAYFYQIWQNENANLVIDQILSDKELWETDLTILPGFAALVKTQFINILENGVSTTLQST
jgi:tagaturonate reductase